MFVYDMRFLYLCSTRKIAFTFTAINCFQSQIFNRFNFFFFFSHHRTTKIIDNMQTWHVINVSHVVSDRRNHWNNFRKRKLFVLCLLADGSTNSFVPKGILIIIIFEFCDTQMPILFSFLIFFLQYSVQSVCNFSKEYISMSSCSHHNTQWMQNVLWVIVSVCFE